MPDGEGPRAGVGGGERSGWSHDFPLPGGSSSPLGTSNSAKCKQNVSPPLPNCTSLVAHAVPQLENQGAPTPLTSAPNQRPGAGLSCMSLSGPSCHSLSRALVCVLSSSLPSPLLSCNLPPVTTLLSGWGGGGQTPVLGSQSLVTYPCQVRTFLSSPTPWDWGGGGWGRAFTGPIL